MKICLVLVVLAFSATSIAAAATRAIPTDPGLNIDVAWFDPAKCGSGSKHKFYFRVGDQKYAIDAVRIGHATLKRLDIIKPAGPDGKKLEATVPLRAGCRDEPLEFVKVEVAPSVDDLPGWLVISESPGRVKGLSLAAKYIQFLGQNGQCKSTDEPQVVKCYGSKTVGDKHVGMVFVVLTRPDGKVVLLKTGSPIHARCEDFKGMLKCLLGADVSLKTEVRGSIDMATISAETLRHRHAALIKFARSISVR